MTFPSGFFHVSSTSKPRTSRYQPRLFSRSFTVKLGEAVRSASTSRPFPGFRAADLARGGAFFVGRRFFAVFFAAISVLPPRRLRLGEASSQSVPLRLASPVTSMKTSAT
jgi:hypothetical protein